MVKTKISDTNDDIRSKDQGIKKDAMIIELTLESFGIIVKVAEINFRSKDTEFCLETTLGTPLENITKLHKDIAMALASPTGDVEIEAPIPGRSLIAIRVPFIKEWHERRIKYFENKHESQDNADQKAKFPNSIRDYIALIFYFIAGIFEITTEYLRKLGNIICGKKWPFNY